MQEKNNTISKKNLKNQLLLLGIYPNKYQILYIFQDYAIFFICLQKRKLIPLEKDTVYYTRKYYIYAVTNCTAHTSPTTIANRAPCKIDFAEGSFY